MISFLILLILEILHRATVIMAVIFIIDIAHNGKIDLPHKIVKMNENSPIYKFFMKIADKLESSLETRRRAWSFRAHEEVEQCKARDS